MDSMAELYGDSTSDLFRIGQTVFQSSCTILHSPQQCTGFWFLHISWMLFFFFFCLFRAVPVVYGLSQVRGPVGAEAAGLSHSHSNMGSEPSLQPTPQLRVTPDP